MAETVAEQMQRKYGIGEEEAEEMEDLLDRDANAEAEEGD